MESMMKEAKDDIKNSMGEKMRHMEGEIVSIKNSIDKKMGHMEEEIVSIKNSMGEKMGHMEGEIISNKNDVIEIKESINPNDVPEGPN